ncbi:MAG: aldehyde dehydrogenase family protein, partial [Candidatus Hodarchaeales archaeon]
MTEAIFKIPKPVNEPVLEYLQGSIERTELNNSLKELKRKKIEIPLIIGGNSIKTGNIGEIRIPHNHKYVLAEYHKAGKEEVNQAIDTAMEARKTWSETEWYDRAAIFLKAADLLAGPFRSKLNAANILGQSKNVYQAEIDSACELIDFFRFNAFFMQQI